MTPCIHIPRDLVLRNQFRALERRVGTAKVAKLVVFELWLELAYHAELSGVAGVLMSEHIQEWIEMTMKELDGVVLDELIASKILVPQQVDYFCPLFAECNEHLDARYLDKSDPDRAAYQRVRSAGEQSSDDVLAKLSPEAWLSADGSRFTPEEMNQAIVMIGILDGCCTPGTQVKFAREPKDYTTGLMQTAGAIVRDYGKAKLNVILKRMHGLRANWRKKSPDYRTAEGVLENFEALVIEVMPDEGFVKWERKG